ncbi:MAG: ABC transporter permease subunit [Sedimentisphaerales bacterium]|nr:ABC transporter permease subunit [Sedimentisphaerales bacterium]
MNRGLIEKALREVWLTTLVFGAGLAGFEILLTLILPDLFSQSASMLQLKIVKTFLRALMGTQIGDMLGPEMVLSLAWVHPVVLALVWGHAITLGSRLPAGEIESGTIDVLLSWPLSRPRIYLAHALVGLAAGTVVLLMALTASLSAGRFVEPAFRTAPDMLGRIFVNLWCLYAAVGGVTSWIAAMSSHRSRAVGVAFGLLLASFLLNFLVQFWPPAEKIAFLSILTYYRPLQILQAGAWPLGDLLVLLGLAVIGSLAGALVFARRSICTT